MILICTEEMASINFNTVSRKSHILIKEQDRADLPADIDAEINVHTDGIKLLGTAIGSDLFVNAFLQDKL